MDQTIREIFTEVERYVAAILSRHAETSFTVEENRILALQQINRLNHRIGQIARTSKDELGEMKILQTYINGLTVGVKNDNLPQIKATMARAKSYLEVN